MLEARIQELFYQKVFGADFTDVTGKSIQVLDFGEHNFSAGPDFLNATIRYDELIWKGHIEFHIHSSDWYKHQHQSDPKYKNVIAHFVVQHDQEVYSGDYLIPTIELSKELIVNLSSYKKSFHFIPCEKSIKQVNENTIQRQIQSSFQEKFSLKIVELENEFHRLMQDEYRLAFVYSAGYFAHKPQRELFRDLAESLDVLKMRACAHQEEMIAYVFGVAGLLEESLDDHYYQQLQFYWQKLNQRKQNYFNWKTTKIRPFAHPIRRIAAFAVWIYNGMNFTKKMSHFYWDVHYDFAKRLPHHSPILHQNFLNLLQINAGIPLKWWELNRQENSQMNALLDYRSIPFEKNNITDAWSSIGVQGDNALYSQGLLHQYHDRCNQKKCLFCGIGKEILST